MKDGDFLDSWLLQAVSDSTGKKYTTEYIKPLEEACDYLNLTYKDVLDYFKENLSTSDVEKFFTSIFTDGIYSEAVLFDIFFFFSKKELLENFRIFPNDDFLFFLNALENGNQENDKTERMKDILMRLNPNKKMEDYKFLGKYLEILKSSEEGNFWKKVRINAILSDKSLRSNTNPDS